MEQKTKIVFVLPNMNMGGAERSLINLLNEFDYNRYEVDLFLISKNGGFLNQIPKQVNLLPTSELYQIFANKPFQILIRLFKINRLDLIWNKLIFAFLSRIIKNSNYAEQYLWKYLKAFFPIQPKQYDVAIGYLEKTSNYIAMDVFKAKKKILYIHSDYKEFGMIRKFDLPFFEKANYIVTVSRNCVNSLISEFPELAYKFKKIENISSVSLIHQKANQKIHEDLNGSIVSVGRLVEAKAFDRAISALKILRDRNINIQWFVIGEGELRISLENQIRELKLSEYFHLLGERENPYPYINNALIYCQTSKVEGKSIAMDEAKILEKPILVTNYPTVKDQITHLENGYICNMDSNAIANGLEFMIKNPELRELFSINLSKEAFRFEEELNKFYCLIDD